MPSTPDYQSAADAFFQAVDKSNADAALKGQTEAALTKAHEDDTKAGAVLSTDNTDKLDKANKLKALIDQLASPSSPPVPPVA